MDVAQSFAATFVDELAAQGVEYACVSPGSRSAPVAMALQRHPRIKVIVHVDERSGSFFGVGLGKATGKPAVLLCTSGTAAAEFHPAVVEASYSRTPLIVLTADRPPELRDVGANQAIDQQHLYGTAVRWFFDPGPPVDIPGAARMWRRLAARAVAEADSGPVHINLPFREPLVPPPGQVPSAHGDAGQTVTSGRILPTPAQLATLASALQRARRPLVVAGEMRDGERLGPALTRLGLPVLAEPGSQLRRTENSGAVEAYEALLRAGWSLEHGPDLVIRVGATPTSRAMNSWLAAASPPTFLIDPDHSWRDQDQVARHIVACDPQALLEALPPMNRTEWRDEWLAAGKKAGAAISATLISTPLHEGHVVRALASRLPDASQVFIGSSMPIRAADSFWPLAKAQQRFYGNRGASGIDGLVSTGLGVATGRSEVPTVLLLGDLSLYHDMNGLWTIGRHGVKATLVVCDNNGGGVFNFLPQAQHQDVFEEIFATPLGLDFAQVARLYGLVYSPVHDRSGLEPAISDAIDKATPTMVVVRFKRDDSVSGHRLCWEAAAAALRS
ncbi:MAG: 2-succinyl-5-enolpyruvyl-6-hydroxy-3-cyclohexene-1-carboxylic-acid synthase [Actinobacteria bacterium 13_1_20CM_2_65_11]|nr:MAG: 2-succinyl-5-enolpyruvyl-6-hydroxy-3-cyclohexene-1-carboxylic-acid synthase [Chloroflexi bacterium 13_1_40CM_65_17]OLC68447.1 MAG: 2-succinyl-5-enolpyruvyl-6-hydroxy-3-cyclohexene-1-carboxylic-acid synthase [Actinobacteria bacterium 13_1_40CM_4_65_12]OLD26368.1 MAG: 2-succinyl-5-enolpyruvyl-6-hydroxy-3-cyclohexene-1-carboxylic-acid synthase [Chloroflexi bacterium 13_1_40CM_3_65_12]OLD49881.1 MAG: 2-succinyl-5-enolpyruvyl-6-hydroxy-3-cyclohexene-1-carboxylic-acid synthase [Actinobacteria 